jgi:hypothetical protein
MGTRIMQELTPAGSGVFENLARTTLP